MSNIAGTSYLEQDFETCITNYLCTHGGYTEGHSSTDYDKDKCLLPEKLISFIKKSQTKNWEKLVSKTASEETAKEQLIKDFLKERNKIGTLSVLRKGFKAKEISFKTVYWKPENPTDDTTEFEANEYTAIRQLICNKAGETEEASRPDIVLFVNGIPVVVMELKYRPAQTYLNAEEQYRERETDQQLFKFNKGALVFFAVDNEYVSMTTKLQGQDTYFLPFNLGTNGAGNPGKSGNPVAPETKHGTYYLWENILTKDSLSDILQQYMLLSVDQATGDEVLIFPRYHQIDCVRKLLTDVAENKSQNNYLIEHSAGSGKSNTIAWLAHHLNNLYDSEGQKIFNSIIVINDRRILDRQTKDTIKSFASDSSTVDYAYKSGKLASFIEAGDTIVISTIQKFPEIYKDLQKIKEHKKIAVIADEAHQSQSGTAAGKLKVGLSEENDLEDEKEILENGEASSAIQDKVLKDIAKGKQDNISFFAFTATPTWETLQMFGTSLPQGEERKIKINDKEKVITKKPFHTYSMEQAIDEHFILDVLQNYTTYSQYYELKFKQSETYKEYNQSALYREVKKIVNENSTRIQRISEIIVEDFLSRGVKSINGRGKAMVVASSREEAKLYALDIRSILETRGKSEFGVLVAFSGDLNGETESVLNSEKYNPLCEKGKSITESQTAGTFHSDQYKFLVVADKYQTGFSEKLLSTMYVDKSLHYIKAVQTLSRLNRTASGKSSDDCFVLDFLNKRKTIQEAFQSFYTEVDLTDEITFEDLKKEYEILSKDSVFDENEIKKYIEFINKKDETNKHEIQPEIDKLMSAANKRYRTLDEIGQKSFRKKVYTYIKHFLFLMNVINIKDKDILYFGLYVNELRPYLSLKTGPIDKPELPKDIDKLIQLDYFRVDNKVMEAIKLESGTTAIVGPGRIGAGGTMPIPGISIPTLVDKLNKKYGTEFSEEDIVPAIKFFIKGFEKNQDFCNERLIQQYPLYNEKYCSQDGDEVIFETADSANEDDISEDLKNVINTNTDFYTDFKDELKMPVYNRLRDILKIA